MSKIIGHIYSNPIRLKLYRDKCVKNPSLTEKLLTDVYVILKLTKFYALAAKEVVQTPTSGATSDGNFINMTTFMFQSWLRVAHTPGMQGTVSPPPRVSDPDMHHGTCVTHVPWCMPDRLTSGFLWSRRWENVPGIPGACATRNFTYLARGPLQINYPWSTWINRSNEPTKM